MSKLRVNAFTLSLDGFGAGPDQTLQNPLGVGGEELHKWMTSTRSFHQMVGKDGGTTDVDDRFTVRSFDNVGAWILGRNMFGPIRGDWPDDSWKGWWGTNPPYHVPVFVLTHYKRDPIEMEGGTIFHFVTGGIHDALDRAKTAAAGKDVRVGGGVSTIRQYLQEKLIDELHLAVSPVLLGKGENLFAGLDMLKLGYQCTEQVATALATHVTIKRG